MNTNNKSLNILFSIFIIAILILTGCSSSGLKRSEKASSTLESMDKDVKSIIAQLDATAASLAELTKPGQSDIKKAFDQFSKNVSSIEKLENSFSKNADDMKTRGNDYFGEWQKEDTQYDNPELQAISERRRAELSEVYGKVTESSLNMKEPFKAYVSGVKEIQSFLSNDLTAKGIEAVAPVVSKAVNEGDTLKYAIKDLENALERARAEMTQSGR
jgi:uncharacterized phage infection (PIP) family protein YhgE